MRASVYPEARLQEILQMRKQGMTLKSIGKLQGISRQRVHQILKLSNETIKYERYCRRCGTVFSTHRANQYFCTIRCGPLYHTQTPFDARQRKKRLNEVSMFYGISIQMYTEPHHPPHFHAYYQGRAIIYGLVPLQIWEGELRPEHKRLIETWATKHQKELLENWMRLCQGLAPYKIAPPEFLYETRNLQNREI